MINDTDEIKVISVVPRCQTCNRHTEYIVKNKRTGENKYLCAVCGPLEILRYHNNKEEWNIICLK